MEYSGLEYTAAGAAPAAIEVGHGSIVPLSYRTDGR
jgi:hypothetical protein